ncbi:U32 family peptidase [Candidatus Uhrbacteria bacterium]|jgi:U32 family peptidase|nr:U32 family peptidase [Candidatus Uhrbacteria bacterium]
MKTDHIKILAPAGSYESLRAAIAAGCHAVYFGVTQLNMRAIAASNFDIEDLAEITKICHDNNVQAHLAVNTILYEHDITLVKKIIDAAKANGVDAIIASDIAAITYAQSIEQAVHISTMQSISNYEAVKYFSQFADVVVLAREVTIPMMKRIHEQIVEDDLRGPSGELVKLEVFAHGALCIAVSGQCFMSLNNHNASACRGACRQECRREYQIIDKETGQEMTLRNNFVMSPSDMCTIDILDQLVDAGVTVLKFEGRGRPPEYVDTVISTYKEALHAIEDGTYGEDKFAEWVGRLEKVYNRKFSNGYYLGRKGGFWTKTGHSQAKEERIFLGKVTHYFPKIGIAELKLEANDIEVGQNIIITGKTTGLVRDDVKEIRDDKKEEVSSAKRGETVSIPVSEKVRINDRVYKLIPREDFK